MATTTILLIFFAGLTLVLSDEDHICPKGAVWNDCDNCDSYCPTGLPCTKECKRRCVCINKKYVMGPDNKCIPKKQCPPILNI